ncbi:MAG: alpha/beta hydrolase family protein [Planctomycetia bacterium]
MLLTVIGATALYGAMIAADAAKEKDAPAGLRSVVVQGTPRERGRIRGAAFAAEIKAAVADEPRLKDSQPPSKPLDEEIAGLAEGAGVSADDLRAIQPALAASVTAIPSLSIAGGRTVGRRLLQAVRFEPTGASESVEIVQVVVRSPVGGGIVYLTRPALAGAFAGLNERGVSIVASSKTGASPSMVDAVQSTLEQTTSFGDALDRLDRVAAAGDGFVMGDGRSQDVRFLGKTANETSATIVYGKNDSVDPAGFADGLSRDMDLERRRAEVDGRGEPWTTADLMKAVVDGSVGFAGEKTPAAGCVINPSELDVWTIGSKTADGVFSRTNVGAGGSGVADLRASPSTIAVDAIQKTSAEQRRRSYRIRPTKRYDEVDAPTLYSLGVEPFDVEETPKTVDAGVLVTNVRFPSPAPSEHPENNMVPAEYYRPAGPGPFRCVVVLHIAGGDFELSRFLCRVACSAGNAALFIKLPYYGERRPPGKSARFISEDLEKGMKAVRQGVLDLRRACDWIEAQPDLAARPIGVFGVSLGAIIGSLASAVEPRISHGCLVMGGAKLEHVLFESNEKDAKRFRAMWSKNGGTAESFAEIYAPCDPATYAAGLQRRSFLMIEAENDEVIPAASRRALWEAAGRPPTVRYPCGHYTMVLYMMPAMQQASKFFREWPARAVVEK